MKTLKDFYCEQTETLINSLTEEELEELAKLQEEEPVNELFGIGGAIKRIGHAIARPFKVAKAGAEGVKDRASMVKQDVKSKAKSTLDKLKAKSKEMDIAQQKKLNVQQQKTGQMKKKAYEKTSGLKYTPPASKPKKK